MGKGLNLLDRIYSVYNLIKEVKLSENGGYYIENKIENSSHGALSDKYKDDESEKDWALGIFNETKTGMYTLSKELTEGLEKELTERYSDIEDFSHDNIVIICPHCGTYIIQKK